MDTSNLHSYHVLVVFADSTAQSRYLTAKSAEAAEAHARSLYPDAVEVTAERTSC